jgi:short subunit dehydrogenase
MGCRFEGQVAVVTGAASGLGEGIAKRLAREGATVPSSTGILTPWNARWQVSGIRNSKPVDVLLTFLRKLPSSLHLKRCATTWAQPN